MAIDQRGDPVRLAVSPIIAGFSGPAAPEDNPCAALSALVNGTTPDSQLYYYDRYIHGATVLLRYLLPHRGIPSIRRAYRLAVSGLLVAGFAVCLIGIARGRQTASFAVLAVSILALARFFGLEFFSQSLGHGPADAILSAYALSLALMLWAPTGPVAAILAAAVLGSLTIVFELFTGGVPLGLAMVIGLGTIAMRPQTSLGAYFPCGRISSGIHRSSGGGTYFVKLAAVMMFADTNILADVVQELTHYSSLSTDRAGLVSAAAEVVDSIGVIVGGMAFLGAASFVGAIIAGAYGAKSILAGLRNPLCGNERFSWFFPSFRFSHGSSHSLIISRSTPGSWIGFSCGRWPRASVCSS